MLYRVAPALVVMSLISVAAIFLRSETTSSPDNSIQYLEASVLRLMMADELAIEGELEKATDQVENALSGLSPRELGNPAVQELVGSASKIRDQIAASDRKSAVESLLVFRKKADEVSAALYRSPGESRVNSADYLATLGVLGALAFIGSALYRRRLTKRDIITEGEIIATSSREVDDVRREFAAERERTTSLQQKLIDAGKLARAKEAELDDATRRLATLDTKRKAQDALIQALESKKAESELEASVRKSELGFLEKKLASTASENRELAKSQIVMKDQLDVALSQLTEVTKLARSREEAVCREFSAYKMAAAARESGLTGDLDQALGELRKSKGVARFREQSLTIEINDLKAQNSKIKSEVSSEMAVIEWSNTKLKGQISELQDEVNRLKAELVGEARRFSDQLAKIHG
jgi:hypothetical protein